MNSQTRDPRVNPKCGDVLRKTIKHWNGEADSRTEEREVSEIDGPHVYYVGVHCCEPKLLLKNWRRWAKTAEVVKQAEEPAK